jgi:hypothetical protein
MEGEGVSRSRSRSRSRRRRRRRRRCREITLRSWSPERRSRRSARDFPAARPGARQGQSAEGNPVITCGSG